MLSGQGEASVNGLITTAYKMKLPDGTTVWNIECPGTANSFGNCWKRASAICPNGFTLVNQNSSQGSMVGGVSQMGGFIGQRTERQATVTCN